MDLFKKTHEPEDVFTPRSAKVNPAMYVIRSDLEERLTNALKNNLHIVIQGDSGTGKSWLYKKVLADESACYLVANLANAYRLGSINEELKNLVNREGNSIKTGYEEEKQASIKAVVAEGGLSHTDQYTIGQLEPFEACLKALRKRAGEKPAVIVFDNLEAAFTENIMKELANLIILCDDERYESQKVRILIVGVTKSVKEYFYKTPNHQTVANRLYEMPEVSRLFKTQATELLERGFVDQLGFGVDDFDEIARHVAWVTDRVPQMLHEYGLELAGIGIANGRCIDPSMLREADQRWISRSLTHPYSVIEHQMNERDTKTGRRNQTLFALGLADTEYFKPQDIETKLRHAFPVSTDDTKLNVPQLLTSFAKGEHAIIRRSPKGDAYTFVDPRYRMVLRMMLQKSTGERVVKLGLYR